MRRQHKHTRTYTSEIALSPVYLLSKRLVSNTRPRTRTHAPKTKARTERTFGMLSVQSGHQAGSCVPCPVSQDVRQRWRRSSRLQQGPYIQLGNLWV
jgi:hypothetical protein